MDSDGTTDGLTNSAGFVLIGDVGLGTRIGITRRSFILVTADYLQSLTNATLSSNTIQINGFALTSGLGIGI